MDKKFKAAEQYDKRVQKWEKEQKEKLRRFEKTGSFLKEPESPFSGGRKTSGFISKSLVRVPTTNEVYDRPKPTPAEKASLIAREKARKIQEDKQHKKLYKLIALMFGLLFLALIIKELIE